MRLEPPSPRRRGSSTLCPEPLTFRYAYRKRVFSRPVVALSAILLALEAGRRKNTKAPATNTLKRIETCEVHEGGWRPGPAANLPKLPPNYLSPPSTYHVSSRVPQHMQSHVEFHTGEWHAATEANIRAVALPDSDASYPDHNMDMLM